MDEGSEGAMVNDPRFLMAQVISRTQSRVFKNRASVELHNHIENNPDVELGRIVTKMKPVKAGEATIKAFIGGEEKTIAMPAGS